MFSIFGYLFGFATNIWYQTSLYQMIPFVHLPAGGDGLVELFNSFILVSSLLLLISSP